MLESSGVCLRPWREDDLDVLTVLRNDVPLQAQLLARAQGNKPEQVRKWLQAREDQADCMLFMISAQENERTSGFIQVDDLNFLDGHANVGICLHSDARGRGLGGKAIDLLASYLAEQWRLRKLNLKVRADNSAAIRCYEKIGFDRCGLLRQHVFLEGDWHDVILMERFLMARA